MPIPWLLVSQSGILISFLATPTSLINHQFQLLTSAWTPNPFVFFRCYHHDQNSGCCFLLHKLLYQPQTWPPGLQSFFFKFIFCIMMLPKHKANHAVLHNNQWLPIGFKINSKLYTVVSSAFSNFCLFVQSLSHIWLFATPWTAAWQASLSLTISWSLLKLMSIESMMPSNQLSLCCPPFSSCLQSFPASGSFPVSQLFLSDGQSIGASASASVSPMNIQDWFPLGLTGLISLQSKGLKSLLQHHSLKASVFWCSAFFIVQLSHP